MNKIVFLPLDERPCNYNFPYNLFNDEYNLIVRPDKTFMGDKKKPANLTLINEWLLKECQDAYGLVISIDTLLYGGIVPSRLHSFSLDEIKDKLSILKSIKEMNKDIKIYAFHLIMRCPTYSSNDEEPDYYEHYGKEIWTLGHLEHRYNLGLDNDLQKIDDTKKKIASNALSDYLNRRTINLQANMLTIDLLKEGFIDFLIVPQDDSSPYGYTAVDQEKVRTYISDKKLQLKAYMYPGADEVGNTLLMRMINMINDKKPLVYVRYSATEAPTVIPSYEDRILNESVKYQILAAGGLIINELSMADIVLMVNAPSRDMLGASQFNERHSGYNVSRNLVEFVEFLDYCINVLKKPVAIGDVAYGNGSDLELISMLNSKELLTKVASYAGWNTSSNTLGTCIPQAMYFLLKGCTKTHLDFLMSRYVEDAGYCAVVRKMVCDNDLKQLNYNYFYVEKEDGIVSEIVKDRLYDFIKQYLSSISDNIEIKKCYMPWRRMFEVGLDVEYKD